MDIIMCVFLLQQCKNRNVVLSPLLGTSDSKQHNVRKFMEMQYIQCVSGKSGTVSSVFSECRA